MKLIAETEHENVQLCGLAALLCDLGVEVDSYTQEESFAAVFWNAADCSSLPNRLAQLSHEDRIYLFRSFEDELRQTMWNAGYCMIEQALDNIEEGKLLHQHRFAIDDSR